MIHVPSDSRAARAECDRSSTVRDAGRCDPPSNSFARRPPRSRERSSRRRPASGGRETPDDRAELRRIMSRNPRRPPHIGLQRCYKKHRTEIALRPRLGVLAIRAAQPWVLAHHPNARSERDRTAPGPDHDRARASPEASSRAAAKAMHSWASSRRVHGRPAPRGYRSDSASVSTPSGSSSAPRARRVGSRGDSPLPYPDGETRFAARGPPRPRTRAQTASTELDRRRPTSVHASGRGAVHARGLRERAAVESVPHPSTSGAHGRPPPSPPSLGLSLARFGRRARP